MTTESCPWLGIEADPQVRHLEPSMTHVCHAQAPPADVDLDYQATYCLTAEHQGCWFYHEPEGAAPPTYVSPGERNGEDEYGPPPRRISLVGALPWIAVALVAVAVVGFYAIDLLRPKPAPTSTPESAAAAAAAATASPTATHTRLPTPGAVAAAPTPTFEFVAPTATPTPYPGGAIYALSPGAGAAGWVASDESRGNHLGDSYLYTGLFDGVTYHGALQFDLSTVPRGATIHAGVLEIAGLDGARLGGSGVWEVRVLEPQADEGWSRLTFQDVHNAPVQWTLPPALGVGDVAEGLVNLFELSREQLRDLEARLMEEHYSLSLRLDGPLAGENSLFAWDSGYGPVTQGYRPRLLLNVGAPPETPIPTGSPPPTATPEWVVVTSTPTPANAVTAAAIALRQTVQATTTGLPTATPLFVATATPRYVFVTHTPTPANSATAEYRRELATARVVLTGTPTPTPPNLATVEPVVLPWKPTPENVMTAAAIAAQATAWATTTGTPTPLPGFVVTATPRYVVVTQTPTPENAATAAYWSAVARAHVVLTGTPTPAPPNLVTATFTPRPTKTPVLVWENQITPEATRTGTPAPTPLPPIPRVLRGKIAFLSDRALGEEERSQLERDGVEPEQRDPGVYLLDPGTGRVARLTARWPYEQAKVLQRLSPDNKYAAGVRAGERGVNVYVTELSTGVSWAVTYDQALSYDPAWSPAGAWITYVSQEYGNDDIFRVNPQGAEKQRLTFNTWEWDKHPTYSPDGAQIVFWANRVTGRRQLWIMNADGSNQRVLLHSRYNDWDPVWIK